METDSRQPLLLQGSLPQVQEKLCYKHCIVAVADRVQHNTLPESFPSGNVSRMNTYMVLKQKVREHHHQVVHVRYG